MARLGDRWPGRYAVAMYGAVMPGRADDLAAVEEAARRGAFPWPETAWSSEEASWLAVALDEASEYELARIGRAIVAAGRVQAAYARRLRLDALRVRSVRPPGRRRLPPGVPETERARYEAAVALGTALARPSALGQHPGRRMSEPSEAERKLAAMTPSERDADPRETLELIRRRLAELEWPDRERMLRAGRTRPRNRGEWLIFASDLLAGPEEGTVPSEDSPEPSQARTNMKGTP